MPNRMIRLVTTSIVAFAASAATLAQQFEYPKARKVDQVDTYHGIAVADPYRWMEDDNAADTAAWVEAENKLTFGYLDKIPFRKPLTDRVVALNNYEKVSAPSRKGPYVFFRRNEGLQKQSVLYVQKGMQGTPEVLIDPNTWSEDGTTRLTIFVPSADAKYAVYGVSKSGSDWEEFKIMELATRKTLTDSLEWVKVSSVGWQGDGFYYSRYPAPDKGKEKAAINEGHQVYFHKVGTPQTQDALDVRGQGQCAAVSHSRYDRGRALRDPDDLRARQGQGRKRGLRPRPVEERDELHAGSSRDRRRHLQRPRQRRRQAAHRNQPQGAERAGHPRRSEAAGGGELEDHPSGKAGTAAGRRHRRREAVRNVPQGRLDEGLCLQRRRQARKRSPAARAWSGQRIWRQSR